MVTGLEAIPGLGMFSGVIAAMAGVGILVIVAGYVYFALALMFIAKKMDAPNAWLAWIPIANLYLLTQIAKVPWWTFFAFLLPIIPVIGGLAFLAIMIWWWWKIAEIRSKPGWWGILMMIPLVNLVIIGILAWGK